MRLRRTGTDFFLLAFFFFLGAARFVVFFLRDGAFFFVARFVDFFFRLAALREGFFLLAAFLRLVFFLLDFLLDAFFLLVAFLDTDFFFREAGFLRLVFLVEAVLREAFLDAFLREAVVFRFLLAAFFAAISYSCRNEKRAGLYIACAYMEALYSAVFGVARSALEVAPGAGSEPIVPTERQSFYWANSFTLRRFTGPTATNDPMRLSKIKLAGFKSFVDPTTITFPSGLVGVVGPNGCGKSNVIDAVRWVMGESSASRLRGDSITDVIFNGSSSRKPVGAASVELLFDNTETTLEGQYAKYAEIAIRREVARDGISSYFLNGTRCRRKDITNVFLGTGLGPRSYSIIEQGMITRLIEAKPEEMRVFLEEAAGISKYKERRRETSNRIAHTKENLDRLMDVLEEIEKQIKHLDRQAKTAERYSRYKDQERHTAAELLALRTKGLDEQAAEADRVVAERRTALEAAVAEQRKLEARIEALRDLQSERSDAFNVVQGRYYKVGSEIARLEQAIEHAHELRERQANDLEQAIASAREIREHIDSDESEIAQLELTLNELVPGLEQARRGEKASRESLLKAEQALAGWQQAWEECNAALHEARQQHNVEQTRAEQIESRIQGISARRRQLDDEHSGAASDDLKATVEKLTEEEQRKRQARDEYERHLKDVAGQIRKLREQDGKLNRLVDERRAALQAGEGKFASLEALQKAALGEGDAGVQDWLESTGLDANRRVAQSLDVEAGWERAVETVLGDYLQAICVSDLLPVTESIEKLHSGNVTFLQDEGGEAEADGGTLATKVKGAPDSVLRLLGQVQIAESLNNALSIREMLDAEDSVITPDGVWLRVARDKDAKSSVLTREHDMRRLKGEIRELQARFDSARKLVQDGRTRLGQLEDRREKVQMEAERLLREYSEAKGALDTAKYRLEQADARRAAIVEETTAVEGDRTLAEEQLRESQRLQVEATSTSGELEAERKNLESRRDELQQELERVKSQWDEDRQTVQNITIQFESRRSSKESAAQNLDRMQAQLAQFERRELDIRQQLERGEAPLTENQVRLEEQLKSRVDVEAEMAQARSQLDEVESQLRELDQTRMTIEQSVEEARGYVNDAEMGLREIRVRREGVIEQLARTPYELETLIEELDEAATVEAWDEKLEKIRGRIDRLGPINLAAIDEFKEQSERKAYLDSQLDDLRTALATLEGAIRKIDRETRSRFRETFTNVDAGFKRLFPKLFGGGHAYLEMTGDDLLTSGVTLMARPPGKRNSTIHLLSGGEKALTAVALVFAIFELNPAPFCLLDEVDAPLDDANVGRYCDIVRSMSDKVQFVFITHNKVTMEMARQLTGVTMQEPGVSRLVSVDLDEAVRMAAS